MTSATPATTTDTVLNPVTGRAAVAATAAPAPMTLGWDMSLLAPLSFQAGSARKSFGPPQLCENLARKKLSVACERIQLLSATRRYISPNRLTSDDAGR